METTDRYQPLLCDIQNILHCETSRVHPSSEEQRRREELVSYTSPVLQTNVPYTTPILDLHFAKDSAATLESSLCQCGYKHSVRGKSYDFMLLAASIPVGFNRGDCPEQNFEELFQEIGVAPSALNLRRYAESARLIFPEAEFSSVPLPRNDDIGTKRKIAPVVLPITRPFKKLSTSGCDTKPKLQEKPTPAPVPEPAPPVEIKTEPKTENPAPKPEQPAPETQPEENKPASHGQGMDEHIRRNQERRERFLKEKREKEEREREIRAERSALCEDIMRNILRKIPQPITNDIAARLCDDVPLLEDEMYYVEFKVGTLDLGVVHFILHSDHRISTIRTILDQLVPPRERYSFNIMGGRRETPVSVVRDENRTLADYGVEDGSVLIALPITRPRFP